MNVISAANCDTRQLTKYLRACCQCKVRLFLYNPLHGSFSLYSDIRPRLQ